jgi:hypothetical protein
VGIENVVEEEEYNQFDEIPSFDTSYNPNSWELTVGEVGLRKHRPRPPALAPLVCLRLRSGGMTLRCTGH